MMNKKSNLNNSENYYTKNYYIGLLSGTSIDGIDVGVFNINNTENNKNINLNLITAQTYPINSEIKNNLDNIIKNNSNISLSNLGALNRQLGIEFANSVNNLLKNNNIDKNNINAIGFHGQTIYHKPEPPYGFTMQLGCPSTITELTQIPVVTDFRQKDMVYNGQGAPLAPILHELLYKNKINNNKNITFINIGGITNITVINQINNANNNYISSDLGPGNTLLDQFYMKYNNKLSNNINYDLNGQWANTGEIIAELLDIFLSDPYFLKPWPKSTGREYFNLSWLDSKISTYKKKYKKSVDIKPQDIQRTLLELSVLIIRDTILKQNNITEIYLCGGGGHNKLLISRIKQLLHSNHISVKLTDEIDLPIDWVESALFAYLAYCNINKIKINLHKITGGSNNKVLLGCVY